LQRILAPSNPTIGRTGSHILDFGIRRTWQSRRAVLTARILALAFHDRDSLADAIPLSEVLSVEESAAPDDASSAPVATKAAPRSSSYLRIRTDPDGYNAGRTYIVEAPSAAERAALELPLRKGTAVARRSAGTTSPPENPPPEREQLSKPSQDDACALLQRVALSRAAASCGPGSSPAVDERRELSLLEKVFPAKGAERQPIRPSYPTHIDHPIDLSTTFLQSARPLSSPILPFHGTATGDDRPLFGGGGLAAPRARARRG
jgi:hypothetical protein